MALAEDIQENTGVKIEDRSIELPDDRAATESLTSVVEYLFSANLLSKSDLPIKGGHSRFLVNSEPVHQDGEEMRRPLEVSDGIFVEKNYNKSQIQNKILQLYDLVVERQQNNN